MKLCFLIKMNRMTDLLFDNEYQNVGFYDPELTEPDYANAQNSALWELHLFRVLNLFLSSFYRRDLLFNLAHSKCLESLQSNCKFGSQRVVQIDQSCA
jgi:hypothetical protein